MCIISKVKNQTETIYSALCPLLAQCYIHFKDRQLLH